MATKILINAHLAGDLYLTSLELWNRLEGMASMGRGRRLGTC